MNTDALVKHWTQMDWTFYGDGEKKKKKEREK